MNNTIELGILLLLMLVIKDKLTIQNIIIAIIAIIVVNNVSDKNTTKLSKGADFLDKSRDYLFIGAALYLFYYTNKNKEIQSDEDDI